MSVDAYLALHRYDENITELKTYFTTVIDWIGSVFTRSPDKEMKGLEWDRLYETYHSTSYNPAKVDAAVSLLRGDPFVDNRKGIYEYVLGGETDTKLRGSASLTTKPSLSGTSSRQIRRLLMGCPTARSALSGTTPTSHASTSWASWTLIT